MQIHVTLYNRDQVDEILLINHEFRKVEEKILEQLLYSYRDLEFELKSNGKQYTKPLLPFNIKISVNGKEYNETENAHPHVLRILNQMNRQGDKLPIDKDSDPKDILNWFKEEAAPYLLEQLQTKMGRRACVNLYAKAVEKGFGDNGSARTKIKESYGLNPKGSWQEAYQMKMFEDVVGGGVKLSSGRKYKLDKDGNLVFSKNEKSTGKTLDSLYEGQYIKFASTNKALTADDDGGSRTSEYKSDFAQTLLNRKNHFKKHGFEYIDGKLFLCVGLLDSNFFNKHPEVIDTIQNIIGNDITDTYLCDSRTWGKIIKELDVPEILINPKEVLESVMIKYYREIY